jgi:hypothetical protein
MNRTSWKEIMLGAIAGLSLVTSPAVGKMSDSTEELVVQADNRRPGSLNMGPGSMPSGREEGDHTGRHGRDAMVVAQAGDDVRQDDRRIDRREDRRFDRRNDRHMDRRENRREDRQFNRREDRQADRREDLRSNAGSELRGLDRADHVAGEHGREGRENARMMHERPNRPERFERMERPERPDRPERPERPERSGRN